MIIAELWMKISLTVMSVCCGSAVFAQDKYQTSVSAQSQRALLTAKSELKLGLDGKGVVKLQQLAQAQPNYYAAQYNLGLALAEKGDAKPAIEALGQARDIRERDAIDDFSIYSSLGWAYMLDGQFSAAEKQFEVARRNEGQLSRESKVRLYNNLGWLYMNTGRTELAKQMLEIAEKNHGSTLATRNIEALRKLEAATGSTQR